MKVLVTGGSGFIGSHLADRLVSEGHLVTIVDDLSNGRVEFTPRGCVALYSDFADPSILRFIAQSKFDTVFHLAARPRVPYSVEHPAESNDENLGRTVKLLEACRGKVGRFVYASSSSVYGHAKQLPTAESSPHAPASPYALQKATAEHYCAMFSDLYGMQTASVRPFNVFGSRQLANGAYGTVVSSWLHGIKHKTELRSDGDGLQSRDMTHVDDVVDVFYRVAAYDGTLRGEAFNAGTGSSVTNTQIMAWLLSRHPDARERVKDAPPRPGDVRATKADMTATSRVLGWTRKVEFWKGLADTHEWAMGSDLF